MVMLNNSPEYDVLFVNYSRRVDQINRNSWMLSVDPANDAPKSTPRFKQSLIRILGAAAIGVALMLTSDSALAAAPQSGMTDRDDRHGAVVTVADLVQARRHTAALSDTLPTGPFDPQLTP